MAKVKIVKYGDLLQDVQAKIKKTEDMKGKTWRVLVLEELYNGYEVVAIHVVKGEEYYVVKDKDAVQK